MDPLISIIIPIYNAENLIGKLLNSVTAQTLHEIEIICVNDCSTDNSLYLLNEYAQKDLRIKVINNEVNLGVSLTRNRGIDVARGKFIGFVDNDDIIKPDMFKNLYSHAEQNKLDMVRCNVLLKDGDTETYNIFRSEFSDASSELRDQMLKLLLYSKPEENAKGYWCSGVWNKIFRKEYIDNLGLRFLSERDYPYEDFLFNLRFLLSEPKVGFVDDTSYIHYCDTPSLSRKYSYLSFFRGEKTLSEANSILNNSNDEYIDRFYYRYWSVGFFGIINEIRNNPELSQKMKNIYSICTNKMVLKSTQNIEFRQIEKFGRSLEIIKICIWYLLKINSKFISLK